MSAKDWFGVAVRLLGLWQIVEAAGEFVNAYGASALWWQATRDAEKFYVLTGLVQALVGLILLVAADKIVSFAYRPPAGDDPAEIPRNPDTEPADGPER